MEKQDKQIKGAETMIQQQNQKHYVEFKREL